MAWRTPYAAQIRPDAAVFGFLAADAKAEVDATDDYMRGVDNDYQAAYFKGTKLLAAQPRGKELFLQWAAVYAEWLAFARKVGEEGISEVDGSDVEGRAQGYKRQGEAFQKQLVALLPGSSLTPVPQDKPVKPLINLGDTVSDVKWIVGGLAAIALVVALKK